MAERDTRRTSNRRLANRLSRPLSCSPHAPRPALPGSGRRSQRPGSDSHPRPPLRWLATGRLSAPDQPPRRTSRTCRRTVWRHRPRPARTPRSRCLDSSRTKHLSRPGRKRQTKPSRRDPHPLARRRGSLKKTSPKKSEHPLKKQIALRLVFRHQRMKSLAADRAPGDSIRKIIDDAERIAPQSGLASQISLARKRHPDDIAPLPNDPNFRFCLKTRPGRLHINRIRLDRKTALFNNRRNQMIRHRRCFINPAIISKRGGPKRDIIRTRNQRAGRQILAKRSDRIDGNQIPISEIRKSLNVCPMIDRMRRRFSLLSMPVQNRKTIPLPNKNRTVSSLDSPLLPRIENLRIRNARPADKGNFHIIFQNSPQIIEPEWWSLQESNL